MKNTKLKHKVHGVEPQSTQRNADNLCVLCGYPLRPLCLSKELYGKGA